MRTIAAVLVALVAAAAAAAAAQRPTWDHQTTTYHATKKPVTVKDGDMTVTPFFSPDTSIELETKLVEEAATYVEIGIPGFGSWSGCGCYINNSAAVVAAASEFESPGDYPNGCTVADVRAQEAFPIFQALLNALHRGVTVNILTNYYETHCGASMIDPLTFLALAGADVRYYTTTTFLHTKYMAADKKKAAVSSVNFSQTSFRKNREAGVLLEGGGAAEIIAFLHATWSADFSQGLPWPSQKYSAAQMAIIQNKTLVPVVIPAPISHPGAYVTTLQPVSGYMDLELIDSPDYAWETISAALNQTTTSFQLFIYQVTDDQFCDEIIKFQRKGLSMKILVSERIFSEPDYEKAKVCYEKLYAAGVPLYETARDMYDFSHQKYWILDNKHLFMSTGNWGQTDYPTPASSDYPPYGQPGWRNTNRDYTVHITNKDIIAQFAKVLDEDHQRGSRWYPEEA